ncbi:hypothetical protein BVX98_03265 [bacterium F11]|nr:hypothetical protein BVX98_03265 [bacterium F11]
MDLLEVAKIQEGHLHIDRKPMDLIKIVKKELEDWYPAAKAKGIHLQYEGDDHLKGEFDVDKMRHSISNLISNAIKYSDKGVIKVEVHHLSNQAHCSVSDQGHGIPKKDLNRIFDRFYQDKRTSKGSGLGLTIAKAWVEAHGGKIWAESEGEGKGTKVTFTLPIG